MEILTVFLEPGLSVDARTRSFVDYSRMQYRSLATLRTFAWTGESFDASEAAREVRDAAEQPAIALRRGYPLLDGVEGS